MTFEELKKFIQEEVERLDKHFPIEGESNRAFARMTKITEELGELCEAVLSYYSLQRRDKPKAEKKDVGKELADTIIGLFILAHRMNIDVEKALKEKIEIIRNRKY